MRSLQIVLGLLLAAGGAAAQQYTISTVAGIPGVRGWYGDGAAATGGELDVPLRIAVDSQGNFYFVDYLSYVIREVTTDGILHTVAGSLVTSSGGGNGFSGDGEAAISAKISDVHGLVVDKNGNLYLADTSNARVRRVDTKGVITTIAGNGVRGYTGDGGAAINAELVFPVGVAVDSSGNVYIADYGNSTVRKVSTNGTITTFAGTGAWGYGGDGGPASKATLGAPYGLAIDPAGNIYVSDTSNLNIRKITPDGNIQTVVTNVNAESIAVDAAGNIYFPDYVSSTVQKILPSGSQFAIAGTFTASYSGDGGLAAAAALNQPHGVAVDSAGNVYVADTGNQLIRLLTPAASTVSIANAASGAAATIAPGEIVVIYGPGIGPSTLAVNQPDANGVYSRQLAGTVVSFNGTNAPILYSSASQVAAIVPYETTAGGVANVSVSYQDNVLSASIPVGSSMPGIFTSTGNPAGQAAAINQNGSLNSAAAPAATGTTISLYVTGEGQTIPSGIDGKVASGSSLPYPVLSTTATISGQPAVVSYAGAAPGAVAGVMQVNLVIPAGLQSSDAAPVVIQVGNVPSQTATIAISGN
jgi:uncharacterized protein (TIGR03437 family)